MPGRASLEERLTALASNERVSAPLRRGGKYYGFFARALGLSLE